MAEKPIAFLFVDKGWYESSLGRLLGKPKSESRHSVHLLIGEMKDDADPQGVWMKGVKTSMLRQDGAETEMDFLVPWAFVVGLGRTKGPTKTAGFGPNVTILTN
jgi:hypothetical protein